MASMVVQVMGLFLSVIGWCLESSSTNSAVWRTRSNAEAVMTSSSTYEGLWLSCATNSMGAIQCQRYKTVLGLPAVSLANNYWRLSSVSGSVIISVRQYQNLWQSCAEGSTGVSNCRTFQSLLALDGYIQACRAMMIIALILGLLSIVLALLGLKCTKLGSTSENTKGKMALTAGVLFILSGVCVLVAVSWYAARVVQEFNDPFYGGTKFELGTGLYLGWAAAALVILGGGFLCTSCKSNPGPAQTRGYSYNYTSQPQKIYTTEAPSDYSSSKAYV
ncbi:Claudin-15 [Triplophysa tibetana]|uniref:Claudin-15 n=1 Tax=Triplophysa tibetana TaxID=1572043 RepID=A0A5A9MYJ9_9TELE|nr:Claudin-15 [Triplophysa tibetana]